MPCASPVALARLAIEPGDWPHTFDANSARYDFMGETLQKKATIAFSPTIRGTRSESKERRRLGPYLVGGTLSIPVDVAAMDNWLPRILGEVESNDSFAMAETLPAFGALLDLGGNTHQFKDCMVHQAVFRGQAYDGGESPMPLSLDLAIFGKSEATGTSFPAASLSTAANTSPLIFEDGSFTIQSATRQVMKFQVTINNYLRPRWSIGQLYPSCLYPAGRSIIVDVITPYTSTEAAALYDQSYAGAAATLTFTNGNTSLSFSFSSRSPAAWSGGSGMLARTVTCCWPMLWNGSPHPPGSRRSQN